MTEAVLDRPAPAGTRKCRPTLPPVRGLAERNALVVEWRNLPIWVARRYYAGCRADMADLAAEGVLGLIRAAELWSPERGVRFSTYAVGWIRSYMQKSRRLHALVRVPEHAADEVSPVLIGHEEVLRRHFARARMPADPAGLADLRHAIGRLPALQREIIYDRLAGASLAEMAAARGCSYQRVQQVQAAAFRRLREMLTRTLE